MERELIEYLNHINPALLNYQDWVNVGMALKFEGYSPSDWDAWSQKDPSRYHGYQEIESKWNSFNGSSSPVTGGTIVALAKEQGYFVSDGLGESLDWDSVINDDDMVIVNKSWIEGKDVIEPKRWNPRQQLIRYLEALFDSDENVGYVSESFNKDGKYIPKNKGNYDRTASQLIEQLSKASDIRDVIGDYDENAGAWIRFNPLDGNGVKNENVTEFKYALVECDNLDLATQNSLMRELELPIAVMVYSGKKSVHAIVRIDAANYQEYRKRVEFLYQICMKNGLDIDTQNKNPSRLSRMPGVMRNGHKQFIIDTNIGKSSWTEWREWIESVNDDLPDPETLADTWNHLPDLSPSLIDGVLRQGHKMLVAGSSKAGKSFLLIELCIAIAEGQKWLTWQCSQGRVLYVNLELDRPSCLHRFKDVYMAMKLDPKHIDNIDIWNLRGKSIPMDKLAPKLIRRAAKKNYIAVIIDPIYKVITGDENSADQMANFCNQFDKVCTELGVSVIYCHHHSKGAQGAKRSMDRASGSGVFARDPDALLDLIELDVPQNIKDMVNSQLKADLYRKCIIQAHCNVHFTYDDLQSAVAMQDIAQQNMSQRDYELTCQLVDDLSKKLSVRTSWRIEGTLREYPKFEPVNMWFDYPIHTIDHDDVLKDINPDMPVNPYKKKSDKPKETKLSKFEQAFQSIELEGREVSAKELAEKMEIKIGTINKWLATGDRGKPEITSVFEKYYGENQQVYIRRKGRTS